MEVKHPADIILEHMKVRNWRQIDLCRASGISDSAMSRLIGKKRSISPQVAIKLSKVFDVPAKTWLGIQAQWDLHRAERKL